ncbi:unnamed protein product [Amoebophrya sp. A25]|nr:unnamed protein product [Amoebophrya sp. A25]|eukprot:GSA25T00020765001.1
MHKSNWHPEAANPWRYGLAANLKFALIELAQVGRYDSLIVLELDMVIFNPLRMLYFLCHVSDTRTSTSRRFSSTAQQQYLDRSTPTPETTARTTSVSREGLFLRQAQAEDVSQDSVFFTNGDFHFVHEGFMIFTKIQDKRTGSAPAGNVLDKYTPTEKESLFLQVGDRDGDDVEAVEDVEEAAHTPKTEKRDFSNGNVQLSQRGKEELSVFEQILLLTEYMPVTQTSINGDPATARTDFHHGRHYYAENGLGAGMFYYFFQKLKLLKPHVLDRCDWNYYLELQFRSKGRNVGGEDVHEIMFGGDGRGEEGASASTPPSTSSSTTSHEKHDALSQDEQDETLGTASSVLSWYSTLLHSVDRDPEIEQLKYLLLELAGAGHEENDDKAGGRGTQDGASSTDHKSWLRLLDMLEWSELPRLGVRIAPVLRQNLGERHQFYTDLTQSKNGTHAYEAVSNTLLLLKDRLRHLLNRSSSSKLALFPSRLQPRWCRSASLMGQTPGPNGTPTYALCLQWPVEVAEYGEARVDRCTLDRGPPTVVHKLDRDIMLQVDSLQERLPRCDAEGVY